MDMYVAESHFVSNKVDVDSNVFCPLVLDLGWHVDRIYVVTIYNGCFRCMVI